MQLPRPVRAMVGLMAVAADEMKHLPDRAVELPMLALSSALQVSLRAQQRYARLTARGDDVLNRRAPGEEPPSWARFDDPLPATGATGGLDGADQGEPAGGAGDLLDDLFGVTEDTPPTDADGGPDVATSAGPRAAGTRRVASRRTPRSSATDPATDTKAVNPPRHAPPSAFDSAGE